MASTGAPRVGQLLRRLGKQETMWHVMFTRGRGTGMLQYSLVVDSDRELETGVVKRALEALQTQFPMLRARVETRSDGHWLVSGSCPSVQLSELPAGDDWLKHHHNKLDNEVIDTAGGPLWTASVLHRPCNVSAPVTPSHRAVLYLSFCHTITDGLSNAMICRQLTENLDRAVRGCEIDVTDPCQVCPSMEELLGGERVPISWPLLAALARTARALLRRRPSRFLQTFVAPFDPDRLASYACRTVPAVLSAEQTTLLLEQCRRHGVTMTAALSAAVGLAGVRLLSAATGAPADAAAVMRTMWLVNARRYVADAPRVCLSAVAFAAAYLAVDGDDAAAFWRVAGDAHSRLNRQLELKLPLLAVKAMSLLARPDKAAAATSRRTASGGAQVDYNINNTGRMYASAPAASAVRAVELHRTFRAHPALEHLFGSHCFHTVDGRLCYDFNYLSGRVRDEDARRFSELVVQLVREATVPAHHRAST